MNSSEFKERISNLTIWKRGEERAPHKPLLILLALGKLQTSKTRFLSYEDARKTLKDLLIEFGPIRKSYHPEEPFVRLSNDGIWSLNTSVSKENIKDKWLLSHEVVGGFTDEIYSLLLNDQNIIREVAEIVLNSHFPETIHDDILSAVGLDFSTGINKNRNPEFRDKVLRAYEYRCAICGFDVRLGNKLVGVEAAHIKWYQAGGPDIENNGIALCTMHHKLFDRGVFTLSSSGKLIVSEEAHGTNGFNEWLMRYHNKEFRLPIRFEYRPQDTYMNWHIREVFRSPARVSY